MYVLRTFVFTFWICLDLTEAAVWTMSAKEDATMLLDADGHEIKCVLMYFMCRLKHPGSLQKDIGTLVLDADVYT